MTNTVKKPTKKANYTAMLAIIDTMEAENIALEMGEITYDSLREFVNREVELLDNKAAAAQKRAAAKKADGDALRDKIYNVLPTDSFMIIRDVVEALGDPDVSNQMATARLKQLVDLGMAEKDTVSVAATSEGGKAKKLSAYKRIG